GQAQALGAQIRGLPQRLQFRAGSLGFAVQVFQVGGHLTLRETQFYFRLISLQVRALHFAAACAPAPDGKLQRSRGLIAEVTDIAASRGIESVYREMISIDTVKVIKGHRGQKPTPG